MKRCRCWIVINKVDRADARCDEWWTSCSIC